MANISYVNGVYCNIQDAKIHINDRGYHFGDAVYEVILYNNGIFYDYGGHINRLFNSLKLINIKFHLSEQQLKIIIKTLGAPSIWIRKLKNKVETLWAAIAHTTSV